MKRSVIFPMTLGIAAALWLPISMLEGMMGTWLFLASANWAQAKLNIGLSLLPAIETVCLPLFILGSVAGLLLVGGDWLVNRGKRDFSPRDFSPRFRANLVWLFYYATLVIVSNKVVIHLILRRVTAKGGEPPSVIEDFAVLLPIIVNFVVVMQAIAQTLSGTAVLSPRFLLTKLRERSRLQ